MNWFTNIFKTKHSAERAAKQHYADLVAKARDEKLYTKYHIPDSLDGRFEAIVLHLFIEEKTTELSPEQLRLLHEAFFEDMDRSLREGGVGDTGISKRVKKMASGFYGRLQNYKEHAADKAAFTEALERNVYGTSEAEEKAEHAKLLADYVYQKLSSK